jgi:hypothetical protein
MNIITILIMILIMYIESQTFQKMYVPIFSLVLTTPKPRLLVISSRMISLMSVANVSADPTSYT